jgi:hypothetical protein
MSNLNVTADLARERQRDLLAAAGRSRLAALARCCRPSRLLRLAREVRARLDRPAARACCA